MDFCNCLTIPLYSVHLREIILGYMLYVPIFFYWSTSSNKLPARMPCLCEMSKPDLRLHPPLQSILSYLHRFNRSLQILKPWDDSCVCRVRLTCFLALCLYIIMPLNQSVHKGFNNILYGHQVQHSIVCEGDSGRIILVRGQVDYCIIQLLAE